MGRKPVLGLVGACLASVAFVGCDHPNLLQQGGKKDVATATNNNNNPGWRSTPQGGQTGGPAANNSGATGNTVANTSGSFNVNSHGPVGDYPEGRSMPDHSASSGGVEHVAYPGTSSADMKAISPSPAADSSTGGLPPLTKPLPTGAGSGVTSSPGPSTLPPLAPPGPAHPRVDTFPAAPTGTRPVVVPPTSGAPTSGAPGADSSTSMPPLPATPADTGSSTELPPVPPLPPVSQGTKALQTPPLPSASTPTSMGIPAAPTKNPANFQ